MFGNDYDLVCEGLFMGGAVSQDLEYEEFSMIVLCAVEHQPRLPRFRGKVVRPAFDDTTYPKDWMIKNAKLAADQVINELEEGGTVLVTCMGGLNRSGLVVGLTLAGITGMEGEEILRKIRRARGDFALSNWGFEQIVLEAAG